MNNEPEPRRSEDHEFPFMELFNAEDAIEHPGEPLEDIDPVDDSDAPARSPTQIRRGRIIITRSSTAPIASE